MKVKWISEKVFDNHWFTWYNHRVSNCIKGYKVYFGDEENNYDIDKDVQGNYTISGNTYSFKIKVLNDTSQIYIHVSDIGCIEFSNLKIKNVKKEEYITNGYVNWKGKNIFYNSNVLIKINKQLHEGDTLEFKIDMNLLNENKKQDFIKYLGDNINLLEVQCKSLEHELKNLINSQSWKLTKPLRTISNWLKR